MARISTAGQHNAALQAILERNSQLVKTQNQIATGKRINNPADDPAGAVRALDLDKALAEADQWGRNSDAATNRLSFEEQTLSDINSLLQSVRDTAVQGANATVDASSRADLAQQVQSRLDDLLAIANRKDANGEYLFSGYQTLTQPFSKNGTSVQYAGDQGVRLVQTSSTQKVADGHSGYDVFLQVSEANGVFVTGANAANTGSGVISPGTVANPGAWVKGSYTLQFTTATDYEIRDSSNTLISSGTYTSGGAITFNGAQFDIRGTPAVGDRFSIDTSTTEDMFTTLQNLVTTLKQSNVTPAERAQFDTQMGAALTQLDQALDHVSSVRSEVGARLNAIDETSDSRDAQNVELSKSLSDIRDLDYAQAVTQLNLQLAGLQAAQSSYTKISQLSLFDYLR
jgi:flagellar hook-associated protein 3 FlgL